MRITAVDHAIHTIPLDRHLARLSVISNYLVMAAVHATMSKKNRSALLDQSTMAKLRLRVCHTTVPSRVQKSEVKSLFLVPDQIILV